MQFPFCYPKCEGASFGLGPICWGKCPAEKSACMGVLCLDAGETCSSNFEQMYTKIQGVVRDVSKNQKVQGLIDVGKLIGDNAPSCPEW